MQNRYLFFQGIILPFQSIDTVATLVGKKQKSVSVNVNIKYIYRNLLIPCRRQSTITGHLLVYYYYVIAHKDFHYPKRFVMNVRNADFQ